MYSNYSNSGATATAIAARPSNDQVLYNSNAVSYDTNMQQPTATTDNTATNTNNFSTYYQLEDNDPNLINPRFVNGQTDLQVKNGYIQGINQVLMPFNLSNLGNQNSTIADVIQQSGGEFDNNPNDYDILYNALNATNLMGALDDPNANLTAFAPNDGAFKSLGTQLGLANNLNEQGLYDGIVNQLTTLGNGDFKPLLTDILKYHVSPQGQTVNQLANTNNGTVDTLLAGKTFQVTPGDYPFPTANSTEANINPSEPTTNGQVATNTMNTIAGQPTTTTTTAADTDGINYSSLFFSNVPFAIGSGFDTEHATGLNNINFITPQKL
jgi:hypothetical protein